MAERSSMDLTKESDDDSEPNQVLMYYKKYSQNPELSKYFTGPEASLGKLSTSYSKESLIKPANRCTTDNPVDVTSTVQDAPQISQDEDAENKNTSPSSSIASNKKLEWDNGADIGYDNSYKHSTKKSASFPSLFTNDKPQKDIKFLNLYEDKSVPKSTKEMRSMYHQLTFSLEPSCNVPQEYVQSPTLPKSQITVDSSSSQNEAVNKEHISSSSSSEKNKLYLQKRIGQPVAYSTPYDEFSSRSSENGGYRETPLLRVQNKPKRNLNKNPLEESSGNQINHNDVVEAVCNKEMPDNNESKSSQNSNSGEKHHNASSMSKSTKNSVQIASRVQREINLCLTKPIFVECINSCNKENADKKSQTSFSLGKTSKSIQTEHIQRNNIIHSNPLQVCSPLIQKIEYVRYENNEPEWNRPLGGRIHSELGKIQVFTDKTSDDLQAVGNSVELKKGVVDDFKNNSSNISSEMEASRDMKYNIDFATKNEQLCISSKCNLENKQDKTENIKAVKETEGSSITGTNSFVSSPKNISGSLDLKKVNRKSETQIASPVTYESGNEEMVLAEMISLNHSRDLNTDIKRSINILQKLLNSKKYDEATKKYYIKKIVKKIVESKYSDDSTSSSDFFRPKRSNVVGFSSQNKTNIPKNKLIKSVGNKVKLMQNVPWYPITDTRYVSSQKKKSKDSEVRKTEILTNITKLENALQHFSKDDSDVVKEGTLKTTNDSEVLQNKEKIVNCENKAVDTREMPSSSPHQPLEDLFPEQPQSVLTNVKVNDNNWKSVKTVSERLLENRDKIGQGDYLLHVATNERQHQLCWIQNEIEHLKNLKEMLENKIRPKPEMKGVISSLLKMQVDDMKVYSSSHIQARRNSQKAPRSSNMEVSHEEVSTRSSRPSPNEAPTGDAPATTQPNRKSEAKQCCIALDACKCGQTSTHEEKDAQYCAFKPCTCQTKSKDDANVQCSCKADLDDSCRCGNNTCQCEDQTICKCKQSSSSSSKSSSSSSSSASSKTLISCVCCKKKNLLKNLMDKLPLCNPCNEIHQKSFYPYEYSNPLHSCLCYSLIDQDTMCQLKNTLTEIERLDIYEQYCKVLKNCKCCKKCGCKCKLPKKFKNGCAYFLKLEDGCPNKHCGEEGQVCKCYGQEDELKENVLPEVTVKIPNCRGTCAQRKKNGKNEINTQKSCPSVMAYLCSMKPEFIERAESRRKILRNAVLQREENVETRKLRFLDQVNYINQKYQNQRATSETNMYRPYGNQTENYCVYDIGFNIPPKSIQPRVFKNFKEMKDLTRKRYLHLSEVRSKKDVCKNKRLKEANRILANTFTKRLQRSTLRGNVDIPPCVRVISY